MAEKVKGPLKPTTRAPKRPVMEIYLEEGFVARP